MASDESVRRWVAEQLKGTPPRSAAWARRLAAIYGLEPMFGMRPQESQADGEQPCGAQYCGADGAGACSSCGWDPFGYGRKVGKGNE